jgi:hypothetical protein
MSHLAGAGGQVLGRVVTVPEKAGAFAGNVHTVFLPGQLFGIFDGRVGDGLAVDLDGAVFGFDVHIQFGMDRIILQQVGHGCRIGQVIDGHDFHVRMVHGGPENHATDSAKAVDADFDAHLSSFKVFTKRR